MANIHLYSPWNKPGAEVTDEKHYQSRREILKSLGLSTAGLFIAPSLVQACTPVSDQNSFVNDCNKCFNFKGMDQMYPADKNDKYKIDRPITDEYDATHYNNFYEFIDRSDPNIYNAYKFVKDFDNEDWTISVSGLCEKTGNFKLEDLMKKFPLEERIYRFRCVERWSMAVPWTGFPLAALIKYLAPKSSATHVYFETYANADEMPGVRNLTWYPWPYYEGLRIEEAMNELSFMATGIYGKPLPKQNGAPIRLVVPWKYGYKNIKSIVKIKFVDREPETFWQKLQPKEYPFLSNIDPEVPHPRWSQAIERMIPDGEPRKTLKYNGYGEYVGHLYK